MVKPSLDRAKLHQQIDDLLDGRGNGGLYEFWEVVGRLADSCSVAEQYHHKGQAVRKELESKHTAPERAYDIGVLRELIANIADQDSKILPAQFRRSLVFLDLENMLAGANGEGLGKPNVLYSASAGERFIKGEARILFVCCVHYHAVKLNKEPVELLSYFGARNLKSKTWKDWCGYAGEERIRHAEKLAHQNMPDCPYDKSRAELASIFEEIAPADKS